jgi:hypothetical protein
MKTESAQIEAEIDILEPPLTLVPKSSYSGMWELAGDGIYRNKGSGTYYSRPLLPSGKRTLRSLKTKNFKIAKERHQSNCSQNGHRAESKLKVGDILDRYEADGYLDENLENRPATTDPGSGCLGSDVRLLLFLEKAPREFEAGERTAHNGPGTEYAQQRLQIRQAAGLDPGQSACRPAEVSKERRGEALPGILPEECR